MKFLKHFTLLLSVLLSLSAFSQGKGTGKYTVLGTVTDKESSELLPYVSVAVLKTSDSTIIDGGITDDKGKFAIKNLQSGKYILKYSFVGYKDVTKNIEIKNANLTIENVAMETGAENLKEVRVVGAKQMMEYKLDKRVINVDQNLVSSGGNASDVLEDVPSVEVDEEGNVTLRGGSNVTLLIDGKPSSLYGSDVPSVLAQIPASSIDKVEVITNPSAKYNPEGMSGIINITLKEKGNRGLNGNINLSSGMATNKLIPQESISASLNWSNKKFSLSGGINGRYGDRAMITDNVRFMKNNAGYLTDIVRTYRDGGSKSYNIGLNLGAEWYINQLNTLGLTFNTNFRRSPDDYSTAANTDYLQPNSLRNNLDKSEGKNGGGFNNIGLNYEKKFKDKRDELLYASFTWSWGNFDRQIQDEIIYTPLHMNDYLRGDTIESDHHHAIADVHYIYPFSDNSKLEIGYNLNYTKEHSDYEYSFDHVLDPSTSYIFNREEQIHALYATYGFQVGKQFSAQLGLRGEMVNNDFSREMYSGKREAFPKDYNSIYPTVHLSYQINQMNSFQISYSRRIRRPDPWTMMPNVDLTNQEYIRFGNPKIDPEYTNAYELGYSLMFNKTTIFTSLYYRAVNNAMNRFEFPWTEDNALLYEFEWAWAVAGADATTGKTAQTFMNVSKSSNYGMEIIVDRDITDWWKANLSMNFFGSYQDGTDLGYDKVRSFNYNAKLNTTFTLPKSWSIQVSGRYYAPRKTIQGRSDARYDVDIAIKKSILNKQGNIGINFRDIFDTRGGRSYSFTDEYISFSNRHPYSRSIRVSFSYNFGKTANMRKRMQQQQQQDSYSSGSFDEE